MHSTIVNLFIDGPQHCNWNEWEELEKGSYSSHRFDSWVFSGISFAILIQNIHYREDIPEELRLEAARQTLPKRVEGSVHLLCADTFPLAHMLSQYRVSRERSPYFPTIRDAREETGHAPYSCAGEPGFRTVGLYLDPMDHPNEGMIVPGLITLQDPSRWIYWPQRAHYQ